LCLISVLSVYIRVPEDFQLGVDPLQEMGLNLNRKGALGIEGNGAWRGTETSAQCCAADLQRGLMVIGLYTNLQSMKYKPPHIA
jgi:hypothetical protein